MFCSYCGKENKDDAQFCYACGKKIAQDSNSSFSPKLEEKSMKKGNSIDFSIFKNALFSDSLIQAAVLSLAGIVILLFQLSSLGIVISILFLIIDVLIGIRGFKSISDNSKKLFVFWIIYASSFFLPSILKFASNQAILLLSLFLIIIGLISVFIFSILLKKADSSKFFKIASVLGLTFSILSIISMVLKIMSLTFVSSFIDKITSVCNLGLYCSFFLIFISRSMNYEQIKNEFMKIIPTHLINAKNVLVMTCPQKVYH